MENPRPDKVATVGEIAEKMSSVEVVFVTEYRGLTVGALANLRGALRPDARGRQPRGDPAHLRALMAADAEASGGRS